MPQLYPHQEHIAQFFVDNGRALVFADPGTGKTAAVLTALRELKRRTGKRALVFSPKSIMHPAWVRDCQTFTPDMTIAMADAPAKNRLKAFESGADIVIINHDGAGWLRENHQLLADFDTLVIDESTAFKNKDAARSKAVAAIRDRFSHRAIMTGTPMSNNLLDIWHQVFLVDDGEHLGSRYYAFRSATHEPVPVTRDINDWVPLEGAIEVVADLIAPICLRYKLEDCVDMPEHVMTHRLITLSPALRKQYHAMQEKAVLAIENGEYVEAVHAASQVNKLLQIASGAVYGGEGQAYQLAPERYDLIASLVEERQDPCIIGFSWKHQREGIIQALERAGIDEFAVLDGDHNRNVDQLVQDFQAGHYRALLAHPQTAGHGLTLTRAKTTIWASPIYNAELFEQLNRRIYRTGQNARTETIVIAAEDTMDTLALARLTGRIEQQTTGLDLLQMLMPAAA